MRHMANLESVYTYEGTHDIHSLILGQTLRESRLTKPSGARRARRIRLGSPGSAEGSGEVGGIPTSRWESPPMREDARHVPSHGMMSVYLRS